VTYKERELEYQMANITGVDKEKDGRITSILVKYIVKRKYGR
jgi:hypothetical protein